MGTQRGVEGSCMDIMNYHVKEGIMDAYRLIQSPEHQSHDSSLTCCFSISKGAAGWGASPTLALTLLLNLMMSARTGRGIQDMMALVESSRERSRQGFLEKDLDKDF